MGKTKKVGMAGKYGPRYGSTLRARWLVVTEKLKGPQKCPKCHTQIKNMRAFIGVWECDKCGAKFTGGAWENETVRGKESKRFVASAANEVKE